MNNRARQIYKPEFHFGLGGVSLGNEFNKHTDKDAEATLEAAWAVGVRYFDVAPWYRFGPSERRFGHFLHNQRREDYLLSSKVGKLFKASKDNKHAEIYPLSDSSNQIVFDYTADGVRRSRSGEILFFDPRAHRRAAGIQKAAYLLCGKPKNSSHGRRERGDHRVVESRDLPYADVLDEDAQA
jgi:hypothetical protein